MSRAVGLVGSCLFCSLFSSMAAVSRSDAAIVISVPDIVAFEGTQSVDVPITFSGDPVDERFDSTTIGFQIGDGGSGAPSVTELSISDTIFDLPGVTVSETVFPGSAVLLGIDLPDALLAEGISPNGTALTLTIETAGLVAGDIFTLNANAGGLTELSRTQGGPLVVLPLEFENGSLRIVAIPEPGSLALCGLLVGGCLSRSKRRSR